MIDRLSGLNVDEALRKYQSLYFKMSYNALLGNTWQSGGQFKRDESFSNSAAQLQRGNPRKIYAPHRPVNAVTLSPQ